MTGSTFTRKYSWSLDISTTNIGMTLWDESGALIEINHLKLDTDKSVPEEIRYLDKAGTFREYIIKFKEGIEKRYNCVIENIFVEAPLMNTPVNIETTAKLLAFNGISCYILHQIFERPPYLISVYQSRKLFCPELVNKKKVKGKIKETLSFPKDVDKKVYIWTKVAKQYPNIKWHYKKDGVTIKETSYDMSDSVAVGYAGLKVLGIIK